MAQHCNPGGVLIPPDWSAEKGLKYVSGQAASQPTKAEKRHPPPTAPQWVASVPSRFRGWDRKEEAVHGLYPVIGINMGKKQERFALELKTGCMNQCTIIGGFLNSHQLLVY